MFTITNYRFLIDLKVISFLTNVHRIYCYVPNSLFCKISNQIDFTGQFVLDFSYWFIHSVVGISFSLFSFSRPHVTQMTRRKKS